MPAIMEKRCKLCGTDVSMSKRTKDAAGNYYCEPCVQTARDQPKPGGSPTPPPATRATSKYKVSGLDRATGKSVVFTVDADTERDAVVQAGSRGMLVTACELCPQAKVVRGMPPRVVPAASDRTVPTPKPQPSVPGKGAAPVQREPIAAPSTVVPSSPVLAAPLAAAGSLRTCANCGTTVGTLQQVWEREGHPVCWTCRESLRMDAEQRTRESKQAAAEAARRTAAEGQARQQAAHNEAIRTQRRLQELLTGLCSAVTGVALLCICAACDNGTPKLVLLLTGLGVMGFALLVLRQYTRLSSLPFDKALSRDLLPLFKLLAGRSGKALLVIPAILLLIALPYVLGKIGIYYGGEGTTSGYVWGAVGVFAGLFGWAMASEFSKEKQRRTCPNCKSSKGTVIEGREHLGQDVRVVRGTTNVQVREGYSQSGEVLANLRVPTEKTVVTDRHAVHRRCNKCGHRWVTQQ